MCIRRSAGSVELGCGLANLLSPTSSKSASKSYIRDVDFCRLNFFVEQNVGEEFALGGGSDDYDWLSSQAMPRSSKR